MIEINLLPQEFRSDKISKKGLNVNIPKIPLVPTIIAGVIIFMLVHLTLVLSISIQNKQLAKLKRESESIAPQQKIAGIIKKEADELQAKLSVVDSLASESLIWSKKLSSLSRSITEGVWLSSLYLNFETQKAKAPYSQNVSTPAGESVRQQTLVLRGSALSSSPGEEPAVVGKFIESLRANQDFFTDFEDIKLSSIQRKKQGEVEIMDFTIICYFKSGRNYFEKLERTDT